MLIAAIDKSHGWDNRARCGRKGAAWTKSTARNIFVCLTRRRFDRRAWWYKEDTSILRRYITKVAHDKLRTLIKSCCQFWELRWQNVQRHQEGCHIYANQRKTWDRRKSAAIRGGIKGVSFHCYLKTRTRVVLLPLIFPTLLFTSSPFPFHPSALGSGPSVTLTSTTGERPAVFRPVYFCLFHRCACACLRALCTVYKCIILEPRAHGWLLPRSCAFSLFVSLKQTTHVATLL